MILIHSEKWTKNTQPEEETLIRGGEQAIGAGHRENKWEKRQKKRKKERLQWTKTEGGGMRGMKNRGVGRKRGAGVAHKRRYMLYFLENNGVAVNVKFAR